MLFHGPSSQQSYIYLHYKTDQQDVNHCVYIIIHLVNDDLPLTLDYPQPDTMTLTLASDTSVSAGIRPFVTAFNRANQIIHQIVDKSDALVRLVELSLIIY